MTRLITTLFCVFCALVIIPSSSYPATDHPLGTFDPASSQAGLQVSRTSPYYTSISLNSPTIVTQDLTVNYQDYQVIGIPGEPFVMEDGAPTVPQVTRLYRIPNTGTARLVIRESEFEVIENFNAMPFQYEESVLGSLKRNESVYSKQDWYPQDIASISEPMILRDFRVVRVTLHPVQVNPVTRQARVYHTLNVDIISSDEPGQNELSTSRRPSYSFNPVYRSLIANLDENALDDSTTTPGSYLILCKETTNTRPWADSLALWKKRKGFDVVIESRDTWTAQQMSTYIRNAYSAWTTPLEFVCLIGAPDWSNYGVPSDGANYDHTFAKGNLDDDLEDIGVGRLSGASAAEMRTIHAKLMGYERNPWIQTSIGQADTNWFHKGLFYCSIASQCYSNWVLMQWGSRQFAQYTGVYNNVEEFDFGFDDDFVRDQLNAGVSFFIWRGSGGGMWTDLAPSIDPSWRLPVVMAVTCGMGDFDTQSPCVTESWLVAGTPTQPRGGICGIGSATLSTHPPQNVCFAGGLMYSIANSNTEYLGHAVNAAKAWLFATFNDGSEEVFSRYNNLMGDPGLSMWTDVPEVMNATHPTTLNVGARSMQVVVTRAADAVPVKDALVVLWKGTETFSRGLTDENGTVELPITVNSPGDLLFTVTKRNHKPFLATIPCANAAQMVSVDHYAIDDDNAGGTSGNLNGLLNPGETIDLLVYLKNFGTTSAGTAITATMSSTNPHVSLVTPTTTYPNLTPGLSDSGNARFRIAVAPTMGHEECVLLNIDITASNIQTTSSMEFVCRAGEISVVSTNFSGAFGPGLTSNLGVTVKNIGGLDMSGVSAELISLSPFVTVSNPVVTFGNIAMNQQVNNNGNRFIVTANNLTFRGHIATMMLIATTAGGYVDTTQFTIHVGTATMSDPTGPDAFGYFAYDNTDVTYDAHPTFSYVNISNGLGTNLNINDPGDKLDTVDVYSEVRRLPFAFKFYGVVYDTITICSNGWLAFGNQGYHDGWRNYAIPAMQAPGASIFPYWDDLGTIAAGKGVWTYNDSVNHRYIVQWKASATFQEANLDFEVILFDTTAYPTLSGNGQILVQYQDVTMDLQPDWSDASGCSIGIQNESADVGLPIVYRSFYSPGSAMVTDNRAILFSTDARFLFGTIQGHITNAENSSPMSGVVVKLNSGIYQATTDATGFYRIQNVFIGTYSVRASRPRFNDRLVESVLVELDSTRTLDLTMLHPELDLSSDSIRVTVPTQPAQTSFNVVNGGNGPLDYSISVAYAPSTVLDDAWDPLATINVSQLTNDFIIMGCEFAADRWWVSGGSGPNGVNQLYQFDLNGALTQAIPQPTTSSFGWSDLAFDGTNIYGSDDHTLTGINVLTGQTAVPVPSPLAPSRAIAYDPQTDHFWVADFTSNIYEINRQGTVIQEIVNQGANELQITGLAWHATDIDGYKLYIFSQNGDAPRTAVSRLNPVTRDIQFIVRLASSTGDLSAGCSITSNWNSTLIVFGGILQNSTLGDHLGIYEMSFNTSWITVTPSQGVVPGDNSGAVSISFLPNNLRPDFTYRVNLTIHSEVLDTSIVLPVALTILPLDGTDPQPGTLPTSYALHQNYPNPFNPSTEILYDLKAGGHTRLTVYNVMGQSVATLVNEVQPAGVYTLSFDGGSLGSGIYFYRLECNDFVHTSKMILMK